MHDQLKELKGTDAARAEAKEKLLVAQQYKLLDVSRPLIFLWGGTLIIPL